MSVYVVDEENSISARQFIFRVLGIMYELVCTDPGELEEELINVCPSLIESLDQTEPWEETALDMIEQKLLDYEDGTYRNI